jgi:phosphoglycerate dehydrogenase-like enzyme
MEKANVVVTFNPGSEQKAILLEILGSQAALTFLKGVTPGERGPALQEAKAILSWNFPRELSPEDYSHLKPGTLVQLISAGADHLPFRDLSPDLVLASNPGAYARPMAEHVMAMVLALAKRLLVQNQKLRQGEFDQFTSNRLLAGTTAGILGFGGIGRAASRLMRAFDMKIYAINHSRASSEPTDFLGTLENLEQVLRASDVVVVSLPLTNATRGLIGAEQLSWMKPNAILVNVARAAILEEGALYRHVESHPDFLLGIDAWWTEPFLHGRFGMSYPFLELPNVLGSPHNSGVVAHISEEATQLAAQNVKRFLDGEPLAGVIQPADYQ